MEEGHDRRYLRAAKTLDGVLDFQGRLDPIGGAIVSGELDRLDRELFEPDWAAARAIHGDDIQANGRLLCAHHNRRRPKRPTHRQTLTTGSDPGPPQGRSPGNGLGRASAGERPCIRPKGCPMGYTSSGHHLARNRGRRGLLFVLAGVMAIAGLAACKPTAPRSAPPSAGGGALWISRAEIARLPTSGPAWANLVEEARADWGAPSL